MEEQENLIKYKLLLIYYLVMIQLFPFFSYLLMNLFLNFYLLLFYFDLIHFHYFHNYLFDVYNNLNYLNFEFLDYFYKVIHF